ncbi:prevent-host-death protein [Pseudomonas fluorescens]|uniref:type II toxin-antitoxin system Phd/YefM family antitoxin n=1 Tax=Pseudomonas fluorescens TaxID=294 RepID=UPI0005DEA409|nr:type II toxin-antitoxin system Phd/YefM family antitoxin [Pseudomonas fluorescens]KJH88202.1 prevent-host-death protein [Pseudomonas fluorescens]
MKLSSQIKPISYLKSHTAEIVKSITESREPLIITQNGEAKLVVMDVKSFEEQEDTMALLKLLAMGNQEIEEGKFRAIEDIFSELDNQDEPNHL